MVDKARLFDDIIRALGLVLDWHEGEQLQHAWRVGWLAQAVAAEVGAEDPSLLLYTGLLHDIGAVGRAEHVVAAAGRGFVDAEDREHPGKSVVVLAPFRVLAPIVPIVADHHERLDGGGFPAGKRGSEIVPEAFLVALADHVDITCRAVPPAGRAAAVDALLRREAGRAWPAALSDAALALLARRPALLDELHDVRALRAAIERAGDARRRVEGHDAAELLGQLLWLFSRVVELKHPSMLGHAVRVTEAAHRIARALGDEGPSAWDVVFAGLLHDVGLAALPRRLVSPDGHPCTAGDAVRRHALETHTVLGSIRDLAHLAAPAATHHERYDGAGYPFGLAGEDIPLLGRILAYADAWDILATQQGKGGDRREVLAELRRRAGTQLDPHLLEPALAALGADAAAVEDAGPDALLRLLQADAPDVRRAVGRAHRGALAASRGREPAWRAVEFDADGAPRRGREAFQVLAGRAGARLADVVDGDALRRVALASRPDEDGAVAVPVVTAHGLSVEAILRRRDDGWELLFRDAGSQARTLERLALFHRNFLASSEAAFFADADGRVIDATDGFLEAYGLDLAALVGRTPPVFGHDGGGAAFADLLARTHEGATGGWVGEVATWRQDGSALPALVTATIVRDATGSAAGYAFRFVDLSSRHRMEQDLAAKNASLEAVGRLKSELLAIASHDLKAPVAAMMSHARLLRSSLDPAKPTAGRRIDLLVRLGQSGLDLIDRMLCLEQIEAGTFRLEVAPVRLDELVAACVEGLAPLAQERGVELALARAGPIRLSPGDPGRLGQVLNNLVSNALRYAPPGSHVEVTCADHGDRLTCEVSDHGPGIPAAERERVFERYYQVGGGGARAGVGLGLHVTRTIVTLHGGRVWVEENDGGGCRFVVELPAAAPALAPGAPLAALLDGACALARRLGPTLEDLGLRPIGARDWVEVGRLRAAGGLALVVASAREPDLLATAAATLPGGNVLVVGEGDGAAGLARDVPGLEVDVLEQPILEVELAAVVRRVRARAGRAAAPPKASSTERPGTARAAGGLA